MDTVHSYQSGPKVVVSGWLAHGKTNQPTYFYKLKISDNTETELSVAQFDPVCLLHHDFTSAFQ